MKYTLGFIDKKKDTIKGFSLLEVMVALAILSLSFVTLFFIQAKNTRLAIKAKDISIATQLARYQLEECRRQVQELISSQSDINIDGDFTDFGYENFKWECHAPKFNMKPPSARQIQEEAKQATKDNENARKSDANVAAPFIEVITNTLGQSVRELAVIVRWSEGDIEDELRVVTHVIDTNPMSSLAKMLNQGAKNFGKTFKKNKKKPPEDREE